MIGPILGAAVETKDRNRMCNLDLDLDKLDFLFRQLKNVVLDVSLPFFRGTGEEDLYFIQSIVEEDGCPTQSDR